MKKVSAEPEMCSFFSLPENCTSFSTGASNLSIDWHAISYQSRYADSFGEVKSKSYAVQIPAWYRELIDDNVMRTDKIGPIAGTLAGLTLVSAILTIAGLAWRNARRETRFPR